MPEEVHLGMADQYTGAMVALVPSREDAKRLAVDGGEDVDQLHCTLLYLGDAADLDDDARQGITAAVGDIADGYEAAVEADGFAICLFNPESTERDPCIVLGLSGEELADLHDEVTASVEAQVEQHRPWYAHVTLAYSNGHGYGEPTGNASSGAPESSGSDTQTSVAARRLQGLELGAIKASAAGVDPAQSSSQRDPRGGRGSVREADPPGRGRTPSLLDASLRRTNAPAGETAGGPLEGPRVAAKPAHVLEASNAVREANGQGLGRLRDVRAGGASPVPGPAPGAREGVSGEREWAGVDEAGAGEVSLYRRVQGAGSRTPTRAEIAAEELAYLIPDLLDRCGPVTFDRIRVAFGGEIHDYPLGPVEVAAAAGRDITPGHDQLHHYWTRGEGLAKWAGSPTPWTTLYHHLVKYAPSPEAAKRWASKWFKEVMGIWSGERKGQNPLGPG